MRLEEKLASVTESHYADYFGIASLESEEVKNFIKENAEPALNGYPRALAVGIVLPYAVVDELYSASDEIRAVYRYQAYDVLSHRIASLLSVLCSVVQKSGYKAFPVPGDVQAVKNLKGVFSNKLAPHLAGLGWIGKSCMLITPVHGPRVIWGTLLTDAPLEASGTPMESRCGSCTACVKACPAGAYKGREFIASEDISMRMDVMACRSYVAEMAKTVSQGAAVCGLCLAACPHGRKKNKEARSEGFG